MKAIISFILLITGVAAFSQDQPPSVNDIRQAIAGEIYSFKIAPLKVAKIQNMAVWNGSDSIKVRLYFPDTTQKQQRIIFQVHGGALVAGDLDTHDNICRMLCIKTASIVVALDYKKPPESPYPAGLNDCNTVLTWIANTAASWGGDKNELTLLGDSGGGLLIASLAVKNQGNIPIKKMVLVNPAVDLRNPGDGMYGLVTQMYLNGQSANDSLISPVLATNVAYLPSTLIITCEKDILKTQGVDWYNKLKKQKVATEIVDIPNAQHLGGLWAACHPDARPAIDKAVSFINNATNK